MIKRTTTIVTVLVLILGVAIVFAKASPQAAERRVHVQRVQGDVFALRNHVMVNESRDPAVVSYQRVAVNRVERPVESDVVGVAHYGRVSGWRHVQSDRLRYGVDNRHARGLVEKVDAKSARMSSSVKVSVAVVPRRPVDRNAVMRVVAVPRNLGDSVLLDQERLTDVFVNSPELVAARGV